MLFMYVSIRLCRIDGADDLIAAFEREGKHVHRSPCLGQCERGPAVFIQGRRQADSVPADSDQFDLPQAGEPGLRLLKRIGVVDPESLDSYREHGGYEALSKAIDLGAEAVLDELVTSGLSGRGGAAFPTGIKWRAVHDAAGASKHIVANCDESEPGTFKDRHLMEHDPFALVEAMTIAAVTTGATNGWVYIRGEYPLATTRMENAVAKANEAGLLGGDVAGSGHSFNIEVRRGAGAYICGEETALFASIEGFRGEPRNKPPFPTTNGLFDQPTVINNPETLLNVLPIVLGGGDAYRLVGTEGSPGTRLFCVSGRVGSPRLYEHNFGATLGRDYRSRWWLGGRDPSGTARRCRRCVRDRRLARHGAYPRSHAGCGCNAGFRRSDGVQQPRRHDRHLPTHNRVLQE